MDRGLPRMESQAVSLKGLCMDLLGLTPSEFQHWGQQLERLQRGTELFGIRVRVGESTQECCQRPLSL